MGEPTIRRTAPHGQEAVDHSGGNRLRPAATNSRTSAQRGRYGEDLAASYLERSGWQVLARNYRFGRSEVDLIVRRGRIVAFVEVKARRNARRGTGLDAVTRDKQAGIRMVAQSWVDRHGTDQLTYRFDAVGIAGDSTTPSARVEHVEGAWGF